jgi:hypothetical protein
VLAQLIKLLLLRGQLATQALLLAVEACGDLIGTWIDKTDFEKCWRCRRTLRRRQHASQLLDSEWIDVSMCQCACQRMCYAPLFQGQCVGTATCCDNIVV